MTHLIVVAGFAGTGKSTLAKALARRLRYAYYDKDTLTSPLVEELLVALDSPLGRDDRETTLYMIRVRPLEYECLMGAAIQSLNLGISAVVAAPFLREVNDPVWRAALERDCLNANCGPVRSHCIWVKCEEGAMKRRIIGRSSVRDHAKLAHWDDYLTRCAAVKRPIEPFLEIDNSSDDLQSNVETILGALTVG